MNALCLFINIGHTSPKAFTPQNYGIDARGLWLTSCCELIKKQQRSVITKKQLRARLRFAKSYSRTGFDFGMCLEDRRFIKSGRSVLCHYTKNSELVNQLEPLPGRVSLQFCPKQTKCFCCYLNPQLLHPSLVHLGPWGSFPELEVQQQCCSDPLSIYNQLLPFLEARLLFCDTIQNSSPGSCYSLSAVPARS